MKTVKIIFGSYGLPDGKRGVKLVNCGETCEVDDQEAARLVSLGVAAEIAAVASSVPPKAAQASHAGRTTAKSKNAKSGNSGRSAKPAKKKPAASAPKKAPPASVAPEELEEDEDEFDEDESVDDGEAPPELGAEAPVV